MKRLTLAHDNRLTSDEAEQISRINLVFNLISILFFGFFALDSLRSDRLYAMVLFGAIGIVTVNILLFLLSGRMRPFILITCFGYLAFSIFLQIYGGRNNTGILWHYVFPVMVFYIAGMRMGSLCAAMLILLEILLMVFDDAFSFMAHYSLDFKVRFIATMIVTSTFGALLEHSRHNAQKKLSNLANKFQLASQTDELTGLANRRAFKEKLEDEAVRSERAASDFTIVMCDIDFFKRINDQYGHLVGDLALKHLSRQFQKVLRKYDMVSRWGGEEFLLIMPNTVPDQGVLIAERIRSEVENTPFQTASGEIISLTVSCGVSNWKSHKDLDALIRSADDRLYLAKQRGRNRVVREE